MNQVNESTFQPIQIIAFTPSAQENSVKSIQDNLGSMRDAAINIQIDVVEAMDGDDQNIDMWFKVMSQAKDMEAWCDLTLRDIDKRKMEKIDAI